MTGPDRNPCKTLLPSFALGLTTLAFIIPKTGREALFFQGSGGLLQLPLIYINIGVASLPLAIVFAKAMKIWGARPARLGVLADKPLPRALSIGRGYAMDVLGAARHRRNLAIHHASTPASR